MCGIAGFTSPGPDAQRILAGMNAALGHRGPDGTGSFVDRGVAFGHTRLAIIDLAGGVQPRIDKASGDALVYNGEIYGYRALAAELRALGEGLRDHSDTEVLFHLIRREGVRRAVERIDGMFAFAYRDGATGTLSLVRDRFGEKPLYYGIAGEGIVFASEVPAMRCHPAFAEAVPDRDAAYRLLLYEYLPGAVSGWQGIAKLEPGSILTAEGGNIRIERYWRPRLWPAGTAAKREEEAIERLDELLITSVRDRVVADVPVGAFLSGGLDSSLITALAAKASPDLTAFTVRIGQSSFDETAHAIEVARHVGVPHRVVPLNDADMLAAFEAVTEKLGEPLADSSLLPTYLVCRAARGLMTVALGGDGADELFLGYPNYAVQRFAGAMQLIPPGVARLVARTVEALPGGEGYMNRRFLAAQLAQGFGALPHRQSVLWMAPFGPGGISELWRRSAMPDEMALDRVFAEIDGYAAQAGNVSPVERLAYQFLTTYLPEDILTKTDRASMFNSLEVRTPFLARAVAEYACTLPTRLKLRGREKKYILKRLACRYLPERIAYRKKHGFAVPIGSLIRTLFWTRCRDMLMSADNPVAEWFNRSAIEALLDEHKSGRIDHGKKIWVLYVLFCVCGRQTRRHPAAEPAALAAS
ncbi:MAG: asparagine synthase (glutamine-hydrolyzing) [Alphaproteobacteria bacterium]|nr:asparagine synthase (glutamine-hydrolyzing) [Alphaproteobacteria bacterium]